MPHTCPCSSFLVSEAVCIPLLLMMLLHLQKWHHAHCIVACLSSDVRRLACCRETLNPDFCHASAHLHVRPLQSAMPAPSFSRETAIRSLRTHDSMVQLRGNLKEEHILKMDWILTLFKHTLTPPQVARLLVQVNVWCKTGDAHEHPFPCLPTLHSWACNRPAWSRDASPC